MIESLDNFTENKLEGNGVFDRMMSSVELHIQDEFTKNRITGSSYAQAYIACIQAVLQASTQVCLESDKLALELEELKLKIEIGKVQLEKAKVDLETAKVLLEKAKQENELIHWQTVTEQAKTRDIIDNGEECYEGSKSNIHGTTGVQISQVVEGIESNKKKDILSMHKQLVGDVYSVIESAEGVGASYYGFNGSNSISITNKLREAFGVPQLDTDKYSGEHKQYMDTYAPDVTLESED